jgi:hypothetical protein
MIGISTLDFRNSGGAHGAFTWGAEVDNAARHRMEQDNQVFFDLAGLSPKQRLYFEHPDPCPDISEPLSYLIHPPGRNAATRSWLDFRDRTLLPMIAARPEDANLPRFLARVEAILAWRENIRPEERFWKPD